MSAPVWVFHAGALGDLVMTWPLLRALVATHGETVLVAPGEKGRLSAVHTGVKAIDGERAEFSALWRGASAVISTEARLVISFGADSGADAPWFHGAHHAFPRAEVLGVGAPGSASRRAAWERFDAARLGGVPLRAGSAGVVAHVGAGGEAKRWPMERWVSLAERRSSPLTCIAGEVERERFTPSDVGLFERLGGRWIESLEDLARVIAGAAVFIGADSGPTHLAAQIGVPTLALFGPTDPAIWTPVGPRVRVLAPPLPSGMDWLAVDMVLAAANELSSRPHTLS